ncbi:cache domain-containing protein, partial [Aeromonas caviae]|uniref:cache domain-containing protein n=1 Tax=Aeromonas caviae TaxID=648 RepID=UPI002443F61A
MRLGLQGRFLLILCLVSLLQLVLLSGASYYYVAGQRYREVGDQALDVARLVARESGVIAGVKRADTVRLNALVERIRAEVGASYIVIGDRQARRLVHPNADRIGKAMVGDDPERALQGEAYISRAQGSLGVSVRGKGPIRDEMGKIIGVVSVGYLVRDIDADLQGYLRFGLAMTLLIVVLNSVAAAWLARRYKKAIFGFEPEQMGRLYAELDCTLPLVREGKLIGAVSSFHRKDELAELSAQLSQVQAYS